jgi:hypothetical protein
MIYVGVAQYEVINLTRTKTEAAIHAIRFHSFALKHAAIQKDLFTVIEGYQMFTACYFPRSTKKLNLHVVFITSFTNIIIFLPFCIKKT